MDSATIKKHKVGLTRSVINQIQSSDKEISDKLYLNFISPIMNGWVPPEDLQGKYKPSWEASFVNSAMQQAFVQQAIDNNLYHYHFGYKIYSKGGDVKYPGDISDGIIHTQVKCGEEEALHNVIKICLTHPSPFRIPIEMIEDPIKII